jgi:hypothetical protein
MADILIIDDDEAILACGCTTIVPKPLDTEQLIACVADLLA